MIFSTPSLTNSNKIDIRATFADIFFSPPCKKIKSKAGLVNNLKQIKKSHKSCGVKFSRITAHARAFIGNTLQTAIVRCCTLRNNIYFFGKKLSRKCIACACLFSVTTSFVHRSPLSYTVNGLGKPTDEQLAPREAYRSRNVVLSSATLKQKAT